MAMDKLIAEVTELVEREYGRAGAKFGPINHSDHESYAVLLEEFQEAQHELECVERQLASFWKMTKNNEDDMLKYNSLIHMERTARFAVCEMIQVAAMAKKAALTVCDRVAFSELKERGSKK